MLDVIYNSQYNEFAELRLLDNNVAKQQCFVSVKGESALQLWSCDHYIVVM